MVSMKPRVLTSLLAASAWWLSASLTSTAHAEDLTVPAGETVVLNGDQLFDSVVIDGRLRVAGLDRGNGYLRLRTKSLAISRAGSIDASGSGYRGGQGPNGGGKGHGDNNSAGGSPAPLAPTDALPGGGGGHIGAGGPGFSATCSSLPDAFGGSSYDDANMPLGILGLGSAGGTSQAGGANPGVLLAGGNGGGVIIIEAESIQLDGLLSALGADGLAAQDASPGGGAGGTVWLRTAELLLSGGNIAAGGGRGASGSSRGGGGGGGLVVIESQLTAAELSASVDVMGGGSDCPQGAGNAGQVRIVPFRGCLDLDGDGAGGLPCAEDCNDLDPAVFPGASEVCNAIDDDCDGSSDEPDDGPYCRAGAAESCIAGECISESVDAGAPAGPAPRIQLSGGLCSANAKQLGSDFPITPGLLMLAAALGLWRRRQS